MGAYKRKYTDEHGKVVTEDQWRYRRLVTLPDGTKERITGTPELNTKAAALIAEENHVRRVLSQDKVEDAGTFSAFWTKRWWPTVTGTPSTRAEKEIHYRLHLEPHLGSVKVARINAETIARLRKTLKDNELADKSIRNVFATLHKCLADAVRWRCLVAVPEFPPIKVADPEWDHLTREEVAQLLRAARDDYDRTLLHRREDRRSRRGTDRRRVGRHRLEAEAGSLPAQPHSGRDGSDEVQAPPDRPTFGGTHSELRALHGETKKGRRLLFERDGRELLIGQLHECLWRTLNAAGLREIRWHDLRHTFASNLVGAGVPLLQVQRWMGHSTINMTMRYAHLAPGANDHLIALLDEAPKERKVAAVG
jgi:integrase